MKNFILNLVISLVSLGAFAQAPELINYQVVVRDTGGAVVDNQNVSIRLSIHERFSVGIMVYQEDHFVKTNTFGLVNLHIGGGVDKIGALSDVKWGEFDHVLKVSSDYQGGINYEIMGYSQLVSVPYALYAANVNYNDTSQSNELQFLSFSNDSLRLSNGNTIYLPSKDYSKEFKSITDSISIIKSKLLTIEQQVNRDSIYLSTLIRNHINSDYDTDSINEIQNLSITGNTLQISKGNQVTLPSQTNNDNDSTNELNTQFQLSGNTLSIADGGGVKTVNLSTFIDNTDAQVLSRSNDTLHLSNGGFAVLPGISTSDFDTDSINELQHLSISNDSLFLSNGNVVVLPNTLSLDNDSTNEIQDLQLVGSALSITKNGSATNINLAPYLGNNTDSQKLSISNDTLFLTNSGAIKIPTGVNSELSDTDKDTKIQVEESADEDIIRFDVAGQEKWRMVENRLEPRNVSTLLVGVDAGKGSTGDENTFIGNKSGKYSYGDGNTALGLNAIAGGGGSLNVAVGESALGVAAGVERSVAVGAYSLYNGNGAWKNIAIGAYSQFNGGRQFNISIGDSSLSSNRLGSYNIAIGTESLVKNISKSSNIAIGHHSQRENSNGGSNIGMGNFSLHDVNADFNTCVGHYSGTNIYTGTKNSAFGAEAMFTTQTGQQNSAFGYRAGNGNITGSYSTYIGALAGPLLGAYSNSTALGYNTKISASNQIRIGNTAVTSIGGQVGWTTISDGRYKENIKSNVAGLGFIMKLKPVTYNLNTEKLHQELEGVLEEENEFNKNSRKKKAERIQSGFVAQEVEQAAQESGYAFSGVDAPKNEMDIYGLRYAEFVVPLVKGMQEQQEMIEDQKERIETQEATIDQLLERLENLERAIESKN